ncbi:hypothetical protein K2Z84_21505 [Candidatus Binatia bacterium]|nr:hypothetical protein [Candidatus Binatia bacterium]
MRCDDEALRTLCELALDGLEQCAESRVRAASAMGLLVMQVLADSTQDSVRAAACEVGARAAVDIGAEEPELGTRPLNGATLREYGDDFDECAECPGWAVFETNVRGLEVEKCDSCDRFADDFAVEEHIRVTLGIGSAPLSDLDDEPELLARIEALHNAERAAKAEQGGES